MSEYFISGYVIFVNLIFRKGTELNDSLVYYGNDENVLFGCIIYRSPNSSRLKIRMNSIDCYKSRLLIDFRKYVL